MWHRPRRGPVTTTGALLVRVGTTTLHRDTTFAPATARDALAHLVTASYARPVIGAFANGSLSGLNVSTGNKTRNGCLPPWPDREALGLRTDSAEEAIRRISSNVDVTCLEDWAMDMIEVDACSKSRYRSLRFHVKVNGGQ